MCFVGYFSVTLINTMTKSNLKKSLFWLTSSEGPSIASRKVERQVSGAGSWIITFQLHTGSKEQTERAINPQNLTHWGREGSSKTRPPKGSTVSQTVPPTGDQCSKRGTYEYICHSNHNVSVYSYLWCDALRYIPHIYQDKYIHHYLPKAKAKTQIEKHLKINL